MLDPHLVFSIAGLLAVAGWVALGVSLFVGRIRRVVWPATQFAIPTILAVGYVLLIAQGGDALAADSFASIGSVRALLANDSALAAGWLHYLGFDLFVGTWIARDSQSHGMAPLALPSLPLTFLFGPAGLLLYFTMRLAWGRPTREIAQ